MKFKTYNPNNLEEAVKLLNDNTLSKDKEYFKTLKDPSILHFSLGMQIRNKFNLWKLTSPIVDWFKTNLGIDHGDDISGIILDAWHCDLNNKPRNTTALVAKFKKHWETYKK